MGTMMNLGIVGYGYWGPNLVRNFAELSRCRVAAVADLDEGEKAAVELGATVADPQPGETWRVMLDPSGHPFCLTKAENWG